MQSDESKFLCNVIIEKAEKTQKAEKIDKMENSPDIRRKSISQADKNRKKSIIQIQNDSERRKSIMKSKRNSFMQK